MCIGRYLFNSAFSSADYRPTASNGRVVSEKRIDEAFFRHLLGGTEESHEKPQPRKLASRSKFEPGISLTQISSGAASANLLAEIMTLL
jgi:hypothetical protein